MLALLPAIAEYDARLAAALHHGQHEVRVCAPAWPSEVAVEAGGRWTWLDVPELDFDRLDAIATLSSAMSQQNVGPDRPLCGTVLPDGQRVQICRPPAVAAGSISLTIHRPSSFTPTLGALAEGGLFAGAI